jgi:hypothetical protein
VHSPTAGLLRPAYVIVRDQLSSAIVLVVRGTHSRSDMFTSLTGAAAAAASQRRLGCVRECGSGGRKLRVPSMRCPVCVLSLRAGQVKPHHVVTPTGVALGYSHLGMLAAARWLLSKVRVPLLQALADNPGYTLRVVGEQPGPRPCEQRVSHGGQACICALSSSLALFAAINAYRAAARARHWAPGHSMGGGTAAMLTMMMREKVPELSDTTALAIACPACMTLSLAASCAPFVTSVVHGTDIVPCFSPGAIDGLRDEVRVFMLSVCLCMHMCGGVVLPHCTGCGPPVGARGGHPHSQLTVHALLCMSAAMPAPAGHAVVLVCGFQGRHQPAAVGQHGRQRARAARDHRAAHAPHTQHSSHAIQVRAAEHVRAVGRGQQT